MRAANTNVNSARISRLARPLYRIYMSRRGHKPTSQEKDWANNLRKIWDRARSEGRYSSQAELGEAVGMSQGAISHYLRGYTALGPIAVLRLAKALDCAPTDICPGFEFDQVGADLPADAVKVAMTWLELPEPMRKDFMAILRTMKKSNYAATADTAQNTTVSHPN